MQLLLLALFAIVTRTHKPARHYPVRRTRNAPIKSDGYWYKKPTHKQKPFKDTDLKTIHLYPSSEFGVPLEHCNTTPKTTFCPKKNLLICINNLERYVIHIPEGFYCRQQGNDVILIG